MTQPSPRSGKLLVVLITGSLGPLALLFAPVVGIFGAPLSGLLTIGLVIHALRKETPRPLASTITYVGMLLINLAAAYVACKVLMALRDA